MTSARRREENVQTTPIAVTALNADLLERAHVTNLTNIAALAPNLYIAAQKTQSDGVSIYLRGFGVYSNDPAADPHVALFLDGIYQPAVSGSLLDMFDIQQVEVQAGPQGTLAGKNAPVGTISIATEKPTGDFSGTLEGDYGSYNHFGGRLKVNFPILQDASGGSILAGKVSFVEKEGGNWIKDALQNYKTDLGGENTKAGRLALAFTPTPRFEWDVTSSLAMNRDPQQGIRDTGSSAAIKGNSSAASQGTTLICNSVIVCAPTPYGVTDASYTKHSMSDTVEVASNMSYRFDPVTLTSVTGYISYWGILNTDDAGLPVAGLQAYNDRTRYDQETEELRLSSNQGAGWDLNGRLDWVVGGYYSNFQYSNNNHINILGPLGVAGTNQYEDGTSTGQALFGHFIYHFTDQWSGTFGVRQSWDHKDHDYDPNHGTMYYYDKPIGFHNTSFEAGTAYQFDEDHMAYLRFAQGYTSGGYLGFPAANAGVSFQEETNNSYEIGVKTDWLDKRLRFNINFFLNETSNLQVAGTAPILVAPYFVQTTTNAGSATVKGFEAQLVAVPTDALTAHMNMGYLYPRYDKYQGTACSNVSGVTADCSGLPFGFAPRWTIDLGADYVMDLPNAWGTATFSADWNYRSTVYQDTPPIPYSRQEGYGLVNVGVKLLDDSEKYSVEFYGTNILDRQYKTNFGNLGGLFNAQIDGRPAEWGMRLTGKF